MGSSTSYPGLQLNRVLLYSVLYDEYNDSLSALQGAFSKKGACMTSTMLAAMFYGPMDVRMEHRPVPQAGPGEVLLQVAAATTCGTDVKTYRRGHPLLFHQTPAGFGHEVAGLVADVGSGVTQCQVGDAVVVAKSVPASSRNLICSSSSDRTTRLCSPWCRCQRYQTGLYCGNPGLRSTRALAGGNI